MVEKKKIQIPMGWAGGFSSFRFLGRCRAKTGNAEYMRVSRKMQKYICGRNVHTLKKNILTCRVRINAKKM